MTIRAAKDSVIAKVLRDAHASGAPLRIEVGTARVIVTRKSLHVVGDEDDIWADYDPERAMAGIEAAAGSWSDVDTDALRGDLREQLGQNSADRSSG
ncbi:MAG TPA: hypothetical protein PLR44_15135 [Thermomicrobiales bacterium]|nr:hypothetical protein [Thermomicrobiales bacterium]